MIVLVGMALIFAVFVPLGTYLTPPDESPTIHSASFLVTFFMYALSTCFIIYALDQLRKLFSSYMSGDVISNQTAGLIRKSGLGLFWSAIVEIMIFPTAALVTSVTNGPEEFSSLDAFGLSQLGFLFAAGVLIVIGWAMSDAAQIAEENRAFV
jgi:hypothetical protein